MLPKLGQHGILTDSRRQAVDDGNHNDARDTAQTDEAEDRRDADKGEYDDDVPSADLVGDEARRDSA